MPEINPKIMIWARETAGLTLEEASEKLGIKKARGLTPVDKLRLLESGDDEPSRAMLKKMAKKYRRPLVAFYLGDVPRKGDRGQDFRTLPDLYSQFENAWVDALVRDVKARQSLLRAALEDDDVETLTFVGSMKLADGVRDVARSIINEFDIDIAEYRKEKTSGAAFNYLRKKIEDHGVFIILIGNLGSYHTKIDVELFRGFTISDEISPLIVLNDNDSKAAWSFTLLHEITHIFLGNTGLSGTYAEIGIEKFCNQVASSILLPELDQKNIYIKANDDIDDLISSISSFAQKNLVSSSMVAYKLYLLGEIPRSTWEHLRNAFREFWIESREGIKTEHRKSIGPNYYTVKKHRLGSNLISLTQQMIISGDLSTRKASLILGLAPKNVHKLFDSSINLPSKSRGTS